MLPSKGYFSAIPCVFYLSDGCRRPFCHYRHSLQDVKSGGDEVQPIENMVGPHSYSWSDDQLNVVTNLVEKAVDKVFREEATSHLKIDRTVIFKETMNKILLDNKAIEWAQSIKKRLSDSEVPLYEPTPIFRLANRHIPVAYVPEKPISMVSHLNASSPSFLNSFVNGEVSHYGKGTKTPHTYSNNPLTSSGGLFTSTKKIGDDRPRYDEGVECVSLTCKEESRHSDNTGNQNPQSIGFDLHNPVRNAVSTQLQNFYSSFYTTTSESNIKKSATCSSVNSELIDASSHSDVHCSIIYEETRQSHSYHEVNSHQSNDETLNSISNNDSSFKLSKNDSLNQEKLSSKITSDSKYDVSSKSSKKPLALKNHKIKPTLETERLKSVNNDEKPITSKRKYPDRSKPVPNKKLKESVRNEVNMNSRSTGKSLKVSKHSKENLLLITRIIDEYQTNSDTKKCDITPKPSVISGCLEMNSKQCLESASGSLVGKSMKEKDANSLHVTSSVVDPFTRWAKNKKIKEILGKRAMMKNKVKKPNQPKTNIAKNTVSSCEIVTEDSEPLPVPKHTLRVSHKKDEVRPYPLPLDCKIPLSYRQHFCDAFYQEFKRSMSAEEAKLQAAEKELDVAKHSGMKSYKNNGSLQLMKMRKNGCCKAPDASSEDVKLTPISCPDFTYGWSLYKCLLKYVLSEADIRENGYPLPFPGKPGCAYVEKSARKYSREPPGKSSVRICANCSDEYEIGEDGVPLTKDDCFYHWGRLRKVRTMGQWMEKFSCCDGSSDCAPCESSTHHVWSGRNEDCMDGYVETTKLPSYMEECDAGIYALDCEMCYTTKGLELARLTVINLNEDVVFDQVVSLDRPVLDYCTRFSGIDETKLRQATYTFDDVRSWVLNNFYDKTILIGHSLENDLKALKLIHKTVIDTSVTFPHKFGAPKKMSLKHLASSLLNINIQEDVGGHDSKEDAATCLKLIMMKIKEDSKVRKPRVIIGYVGKKR